MLEGKSEWTTTEGWLLKKNKEMLWWMVEYTHTHKYTKSNEGNLRENNKDKKWDKR